MLALSPCKINLGLFVTEKRGDGYHNIESVFYPVNWCDAIELEFAQGHEKFTLLEYGNKVGGDLKQHLCYKAYRLLDEKFNLPAINLHLFKNLPMGAGLGGGSSNGSTTLKLLNTFFKLGLTHNELTQLAAQLGSDCPFFIENKPALVKGRGEILLPAAVQLSDFYLLLVHPALHMSTAEAYSMITPRASDFDIAERMAATGVESWKNFLRNDFEKPVFAKFPQIAGIKDKMYENGAVFALMSGSGSSVYALFNKHDEALAAQQLFEKYTTRLIEPDHHLAKYTV